MARLVCIFAMPWALVASTSCAGDECRASVAAGRVLLQTQHSKESSKTRGMSAATELMYKDVQRIIAHAIETHETLSKENSTAIDLMRTTLEEVTKPALFQGHDDDQILMTAAMQGLVNCESNLEDDASSAATVKEDVDTKAVSHSTCRGTESSYKDTKDEKWSALSGYYSALDVPDLPSGVNGLEAFFSDLAVWLATKNQTYSSKQKDFDGADSTYEEKKLECNNAQSTYESSYCQWHTVAGSAVSKHEGCWSQGSTAFNITKATVLDSAAQRKAEFTGAEKILCFLNVLSGDMATVQARLDDCSALVVNTSGFELVNTSMPTKRIADLGNLTFQPGHEEWKAAAYGGLPSAAPAAPVSACADVAPSTTTTTTPTTATTVAGGA